ncbi:hypothetical protein HQ447_06620 [bacterium]|nr:hypothetical protein [bacterium]
MASVVGRPWFVGVADELGISFEDAAALHAEFLASGRMRRERHGRVGRPAG